LALAVTAALAAAACGSSSTSASSGSNGEGKANAPSGPTLPTVPAPLPAQSAEAVASAARLGDAFVQVADRVSPSVVSLRVEATQEPGRGPHSGIPGFPFPFGMPPGRRGEPPTRQGSGSGVIIRQDGYILTNNHVVENATKIDVQLRDRRRFSAEVVGTDPATDLAVVKVDATELPPASFAPSDEVRVGEWAIAIGSPFGLRYTVTTGVVSAIGRGLGANEIEDYVQTDASINPGNSGGPLVNLRGQVIGINTIIIGRGAGIGFAIPSDLARRVASQLIEDGEVDRAWIGVTFQELTPELAEQLGLPDPDRPKGALVASVVPGGPAAKAGIKPGDVIVGVDGEEIIEGMDLLRQVIRKDVGSEVGLTVIRDGAEQRLTLTTGERPSREELAGRGPAGNGGGGPGGGDEGAENALGELGLRVQPLTPGLAQQLDLPDDITSGLVVANVQPGSPAARIGLRPEDVIVEADRQAVDSPGALGQALADGSALLRVRRGDNAVFMVLRSGG
jgi:Do/DeqQ family serine protease